MINTNQTHSGLTPFKKGFAFMKILTQLRHLLLVCMLCGWSLGAAAIETVVYYHNDTAGSPVAATDGNGNLAWREHYRPYGDRVTKQPAGNNQLWFHNKPQDEQTGLSYFGARYYDPIVGRFMGVDPEHFDDDNLHSFNRYAYGNNNPYKYKDPDGHVAILVYAVPAAANLLRVGVQRMVTIAMEKGAAATIAATEIAAGDAIGGASVAAGAGAAARLADKAADAAKAVGTATKESGNVIHVTSRGVALPPGPKYKIPEHYVQNPNPKVSGNYGEVVNGKYRERLAIHPDHGSGRGSHYHLDGTGSTHNSPRPGNPDPEFTPQ